MQTRQRWAQVEEESGKRVQTSEDVLRLASPATQPKLARKRGPCYGQFDLLAKEARVTGSYGQFDLLAGQLPLHA